MKYLLLIPDGMADWKVEELNNKTPLEYADTENMDYVASMGICGIAKTIPEGFEPGSDIAVMTILGLDPRKLYTGRGPLEALAKDIKGDIIFRCNLVYIKDGIMMDYSGGKISDEEAKIVIEVLNDRKPFDFIQFYKGVGFRNLLVINGRRGSVKTFPPHDIVGKRVEEYLPTNGDIANLLVKLIKWSMNVIPEVSEKTNSIWPWGGGSIPKFPKFKDRFGVNASIISEVDLLYGIAKGCGIDCIHVDGTTAYIDTNYKGLARATLKALKKYDLVILHTEGIDEVAHEGDARLKAEAISIYDERIVGYILDRVELEDMRIGIIPDHPTPVKVKTHVADPVPFTFTSEKRDDVKRFTERECRRGKLGFINGLMFSSLFIES